jgi:fumarate reductase subunit D
MKTADSKRKSFDFDLIMKVINYSLRSFILILGIVFALGLIEVQNMDPTMVRVFGGIMILFGAYRLSMYHLIVKRQAIEEKYAELDEERDNLDN